MPTGRAKRRRGGFTVAVRVWRGAAVDGLSAMAAADHSGVVATELALVLAPARLPSGWNPLWRVGETEVYTEPAPVDGRQQIACRCCGDCGIIKYPVDLPLSAATRLAWQWRMISLPSRLKEDLSMPRSAPA